ncbi:alpha/beta hydrolase [Brumimicrobium oceani]|uniref:Alpha/beta hydrolase n=1 Tax=Brumimicrobium oceani TaxID=2100725 RepID=A0A2U2XGC7_9FLAO|nr:alpha/beta fold hydrolase [Brumimicrobium oceani]PWH86852.1 alpha/beta hydrolase [Brumimicrobium oceani]
MKQLNCLVLVVLFISISTNSWTQTEKKVKVKTEYGNLYGSLIHSGSKKNSPVVLIIPGSGPTDRNGNSQISQTNSYKLLAEGLAEKGISSLRYDKLLVGESKGKISEEDLLFEHNVDFATAWLNFLTTKGYQNIVVLGHSEGSLIGILAAQKNVIAKFISLAGTGRSIDEVLTDQLSGQSHPLQPEIKRLFKQLKQGKKVEKVSPELAGLFRPSVQPYLISWMKYSPKVEIGVLDIPILIIHGSTDIQVSERDAHMQQGGNAQAELVIIEGMNHILKVAPEDLEENTKTYYNPKLPLHPELIPAIVKFIE